MTKRKKAHFYYIEDLLEPGDVSLIEQGTRRGELAFENDNRELQLEDIEAYAAGIYRCIPSEGRPSRKLLKGEINACARLAQLMRESGYTDVAS